ncbi:H-NS family nucleoid-associated regulatory protein [Variovorax sp. LT1R16]|uniref:H-NS family nucleoid-associated regulatory protein n=1 Tax=Variovorax sp. LT1R16 TaxID=3443728 RepID=UPI003F470412
MAQTYAKLQKQIEVLQRQAEAIRLSEIQGVIDRVKVAIAHYDLTPEHLFGKVSTSTHQKKKSKGKADKVGKEPKYADGTGNTWGGRGPRPRWLRDAIGSGASLEDFRAEIGKVAAGRSGAEKNELSVQNSKPAKASKRAQSAVRYTDEAGNTWTGRGPKPGWLKMAIAAGKELSDFSK